jgi:phospho-N-acetylmuramoyl-pentapeptide-transferase
VTGVIVAAAVALTVSLVGTPVAARLLRRLGIGQPIHDAVSQHAAKAGTPTMGGVIISVGLIAGYLSARLVRGAPASSSGALVVGTVVGAGIVGLVDDWLKVRRGRNLGLREAQKTIMLLALIVGFCLLYLAQPRTCTHLSVARCTSLHGDLGPLGWSALAAGLFWLTTNAVNFTDGIEGLLVGSSTITFAALTAIAFWQFRHPAIYPVNAPLDLTIVAASLSAASVGLLWTNISPRTIFIGDTGSLAVGAGIAALALSLNVVALVPILGVLYVVEGASSALQRYTYKLYFKRRGGQRRLFRMAPIHHHFELRGWSEPTIVIRFWLISAIGAAISLAIFYEDYLHLR